MYPQPRFSRRWYFPTVAWKHPLCIVLGSEAYPFPFSQSSVVTTFLNLVYVILVCILYFYYLHMYPKLVKICLTFFIHKYLELLHPISITLIYSFETITHLFDFKFTMTRCFYPQRNKKSLGFCHPHHSLYDFSL